MSEPLHPDTRAIHADDGIEPASDVAPPIHVATTFTAGDPAGTFYSRIDQPTRQRLEAVLGALDGGEAITYSSGLAAVTAAISVLRPKRVAIGRGGYFGTQGAVDAFVPWGVEKVPLDAPVGEGDVIWLETPLNPTCELQGIAAHAARAAAAGARLVVDGTFATPILQRPLDLGADLVLHSTSKYLSGHSDALGGVLVARSHTLAKRLRDARTYSGSVPGSLETWLTLRGVRTLGLRVRHQTATATALAAWLEPRVAKVWHPSLRSHPNHDLAERQMRGPGPMLSIELANEEAAQELPRHLKLFRDATSLGGVESLIEWRYKLDKQAPPALLRVSVGLEEPEDLIADLAQGLSKVAAR
ncbi:MAG TPA: PLP-dependent aspartate aminotransferase family protein [Anaeromyxobacteraceae bacterium]|nr:PLP-dependent aspartate aminotransferase family protein [Anaeromyxobacteraceae bacterium]